MEKLENLFKIGFDDMKITDTRIDEFTTDHIAKLEANNVAHEFDDLITNTKAAQLNFRTKTTDKSETLADRKAATITIIQYEENFIDLVKRAEGTVLAKYTKKSSVYAEFFPKPLSEYTHPPRPLIGSFIDHFITRFGAHAADFGADLKNAFTALKASFDPARSAQETDVAEVKSLIAESSAERKALNKQLTINLLTLAIKYLGQPEYAKVYFDTSKLYYHAHEVPTPGVVHEYKFKALQIKNSKIEGLVGAYLRIINTGTTRLQLFTASNNWHPKPGAKSLIVNPGGDVTIAMKDISGSDTHKYLFIFNMDAAAGDGSVETVGSPRPQ
jgi:hypothetical protein